MHAEEEKEELYILQPANKSDRMCHLVAVTPCAGQFQWKLTGHKHMIMLPML